jgi:hypothetical protein
MLRFFLEYFKVEFHCEIWKPKSIVKDIIHVVEMKKTFMDLFVSMLLCCKCFSYVLKHYSIVIRILFTTTKVVNKNAFFVTSKFFINFSYWLFWKLHWVFLRCLLCNPMGFLSWQSLKWMFCMYDGPTMQLLHKPLHPPTFPLMWILIIIF